jgi:hypothetical protein
MRKTGLLIAIVLVGTSAAVVAAILLFGSNTRIDDYWGETTTRRRWGIEREKLIDRDRNGRPDVRVIYPARHWKIATHDSPSRVLVDNDLDGVFEIDWQAGPPPTLSITSPQGRRVFRGPDAELPNPRVRLYSREELGLTPTAPN